MKWRVLISAPYMQPVIEDYRKILEDKGIEIIVPEVRERLSEEELLPLIGDIDGVIAGDDRISARVLMVAPRLKVISKWGTGIDSFDLEECRKRGIEVCNTPDAFTEPVADSVLGYILCFARRLPWMDAEMKLGRWEKIPGRALRECTLGIVGLGRIGKAVAKRAHSFGMGILGNDKYPVDGEFVSQMGIRMLELDALLAEADFVSLNCDLNPTSFHLLGDREFALMKPTAVLVNMARGPIVNEESLVRALQMNKISGAALDVFEGEPLTEDSPLRKMRNVMMAPHNSNSSPDAWKRVHLNTIKNLIDVLEGQN